MKNCDLMFGCLGNGITVCDRNHLCGGDYLTVAHIDPCGAYKLRHPLPDEAKAQIICHAQAAARTFEETWRNESPLRRMNELTEYVMTYRQVKEAGGYKVLLHMTAEQTLALYIKCTCVNGGYTAPDATITF